jgi:PPE-repeat protein
MATAAAPHVAWLHATAAAAERTATRAKEAAAAYGLAFAMTVPPPVVAANRSLLMSLVATNFFAQNTPAIAATEAHYAEMWIQDAAAMYGYAETSAAATEFTPFTAPPPTTDPGRLAAQSGSVTHAAASNAAGQPATLSGPPSALQGLDPPALISASALENAPFDIPNVSNTGLSFSNAGNSARSIFITNERLAAQAAQDEERPLGFGGRMVSAAPGRSAAPAVSATTGRAALVGSLSAPPNWATATAEIRPVALALPDCGAGIRAAPAPDMSQVPGSAFSQSVLGTLSRQGFNDPRPKSKPVIVRSPAAG